MDIFDLSLEDPGLDDDEPEAVVSMVLLLLRDLFEAVRVPDLASSSSSSDSLLKKSASKMNTSLVK